MVYRGGCVAEASPPSQWLVNGLTAARLPVVCVETRHIMALLKAHQINKSDRNDARGIAQMMRVNSASYGHNAPEAELDNQA